MIKPTNGRVVLFTPSSFGKDLIDQFDLNQPLAAMVVHVWDDRVVNLIVHGSNGETHAVTSVTLLQDDDAKPVNGHFCEWMPFQKGQAAKYDANAADRKAVGDAISEGVDAMGKIVGA